MSNYQKSKTKLKSSSTNVFNNVGSTINFQGSNCTIGALGNGSVGSVSMVNVNHAPGGAAYVRGGIYNNFAVGPGSIGQVTGGVVQQHFINAKNSVGVNTGVVVMNGTGVNRGTMTMNFGGGGDSPPKKRSRSSVVVNTGSVVFGDSDDDEERPPKKRKTTTVKSKVVHTVPDDDDGDDDDEDGKKEKKTQYNVFVDGKLVSSSSKKPKATGRKDAKEEKKTEEKEPEEKKATQKMLESLVCGRCQDRLRTTCKPCGHAFFCTTCSVDYMKKSNNCPECKQPIKEVERLYT